MRSWSVGLKFIIRSPVSQLGGSVLKNQNQKIKICQKLSKSKFSKDGMLQSTMLACHICSIVPSPIELSSDCVLDKSTIDQKLTTVR